MRLTVAICTWNRSVLLRKALDQMTRVKIPTGVEHEILVVNNNCSDDTDEVIASFADRLPLRRLFEPEPGQSNARNAAVRAARGAYVLWTDDDVIVDPGWIAAYAEAFDRWPGGVVFGGPVLPLFAVPPPPWLNETWALVASAYAIRDLGPEPFLFDGGALAPFGANFAVRLAEQTRFPYDPTRGLRPGSTLRGEETDVVRRLLATGCQGWWVPSAGVHHLIPVGRMTLRYLRGYHMGLGEYWARTDPAVSGPALFGRPRWLWRAVVSAEARYRWHRLVSPPTVWVPDLIRASEAWGRFFGTNPRAEH